MLEMSSPILIIGDSYLSKNMIVSAKKKYKNAYWEIVSATDQTPDEIRMLTGFSQIGIDDKIVLIQDIPNKKQIRDFILDLVTTSTSSLKFIIWDSLNHIKLDPKTKTYGKTWVDFVKVIEEMKDAKVVDNGTDFSEKESNVCVKYIQDCFKKYGKTIDNKSTISFMDIVGKNKGMLLSEIQKICLNCPDIINEKFIIENTFPSSTESAIYKFGNAIDTGDTGIAIRALEDFMSHGINEYLLGDILMKKARWQLVAAYMWSNGFSWHEIPDRLMDMGKFPSVIWHGGLTNSEKKKESSEFISVEDKTEFMVYKLGIPQDYFIPKVVKVKKSKKEDSDVKTERVEGSETIPLRFMAAQLTEFLRSKIIAPNQGKYTDEVLKSKILSRAFNVYFTVSDLFKDIRYNSKDSTQCIYQMIYTLIDPEINEEKLLED